MPDRTRDLLRVALVALVVAIVATWPIALRFGSAGRLDTGDGRFSIWNVAWVAQALTTHPGELWNANIFSPHTNTLAFSEANLVAGLLGVPVWVATHNPYATMNSVILASFVLAAVAMFALVRHLTGSRVSAGVSGLLYAFCPFAFSRIPQVQLLMTFGPPLALLALHRCVEAPSVRRAVALGGAVALQGLACGYYGIYGGLAVGLGLAWFGVTSGQWRQPRYWGVALIASGVAALIVLPFLAHYIELRHAGLERSLDEARLFRASWFAYLASPLLTHRWLLRLLPEWPDVLFPGILPISLTAVAITLAFRGRTGWWTPRRHLLAYYLVLGGLAMWASFGPDAGLYKLFYRTVPFISFLRAPARLGLLVTLSLVVAGGFGLASLLHTWTGWRRHALVGFTVCFAMGRATVGGLDLVDAPKVSATYQYLAQAPRGTVAEFPYFTGPLDRHRHTEYMLMSIQHWQPLLNGYSDFFPADAWNDMATLSRFPAPDTWPLIEARQVRYVVFHFDQYPIADRELLRRKLLGVPLLRKVLDEPGTSLFEVVPTSAPVDAMAANASSR